MKRTILMLVLALVTVAAFAQNPFLSQRAPEAQEIYTGNVPEFVREWSRTLQARIAALSREVGSGRFAAVLPAFLFSVLFGIVHIAGPGHGKLFAVSYFSGRPARARDGVLYSAVVNLVDSLSALVLVLLGYVVLRAIAPSFQADAPRVLELVSYAAIVVFGVAHLVSHLRRHHAHHPDHESRSRSPWVLALSVGLVPCPVSTILLVYGIANQTLALMVFMVIGVSFGGFITMTLISVAVIAGRERLLAGLNTPATRRTTAVLEHAASVIIIVAGTVLFLAAL